MGIRISRRDCLKTGSLVALGGAMLEKSSVYANSPFDCVVKDAVVLDGTGGAAWKADIGVTGDTITALDDIAAEQGKKVIQAAGLHVSPGFIDIHSHSDHTILAYPTADSRVLQGVTTEVTGNCGGSAAPLVGIDVDKRREELREYGVTADWTDVAAYSSRLEETGISVNHALLVGQGTIRQNTIGLADRPLTVEERATVLQATERAMDQGVFGLSTGLEYAPGVFTPTEEIIAMARIVARRGGLYASHIRNEEAALLEALNEAVVIGKRAGIRVQLSHFKAAGQANWDKQPAALHLVEAARREGIEILADAYPYTAYSTGLTIFLKPWAREGGTDAILGRLESPGERARIRQEVDDAVQNDPGGYDRIVIASVKTEKNRPMIGKNFLQIAELWNVEPIDAFLRLLEEEKAGVDFVGHGMAPENVEMVLAHPLVMIGSDGYSMAPTGKAAESRPHPRSYGTCPRVLAVYARERALLDLPTAVKKMTGLPAGQLGLPDRGRIGRGMKADLVIFDASDIQDTATFENPHQFPKGIHHVLVNGKLIVENGKHTGARPGKVLRKA